MNIIKAVLVKASLKRLFTDCNITTLREELLIKYNMIILIYLNNENINDLKRIQRIQY